MDLTDDEHAIFARRLGAARVELVPLDESMPKGERPYALEARCTVGDWSKWLGLRSVHRIDEPGPRRTEAIEQFALGFEASAPDGLFPVVA